MPVLTRRRLEIRIGRGANLLTCPGRLHGSGRPWFRAVRAVLCFHGVFYFSRVKWAVREKLNTWKHLWFRHCNTWPDRNFQTSRLLRPFPLPTPAPICIHIALCCSSPKVYEKKKGCNTIWSTTNATFSKQTFLSVSFISVADVGEFHFLSDFAVFRYALRLFCRLSTAIARSCRNWQTDSRGGFLVRYVQFCERVKWFIGWMDITKLNWLFERPFHNIYLKRLCNKIYRICWRSVDEINIKMWTRGGAVDWDSALQAGKWLVLFRME